LENVTMQPTSGTKTAVWLNLAGGLVAFLSSVAWPELIGPAGGYVASGLLVANAALHAFTGNAPVIGSGK
jgi:hypothetical protein